MFRKYSQVVRRIGCLVGLILAVSLHSVAFAESTLDKLHTFFQDVKTMRADFKQTVLDARFQTAKSATGVLEIQRPGKFRWDYKSPYEQTIVADGKKLWIYDKDLEQVTVKPMNVVLGNTPAMLLSGGQSLEKNFEIKELSSHEAGLEWLELLPKDRDANFKNVRLGFGAKYLEQMMLLDSFDQTTQLIFTNIQYNLKIDPQVFKFIPPKGVDVIGDTE